MENTAKVIPGSIPKYRQLLQIMRNRILSGDLRPGSQLPTEEELIHAHNVSRGTVRKAIGQLEAERLIRTEQGIGSFVTSAHPNAIPFEFGNINPDKRADVRVTFRVLAQEIVPAPIDVAERLRLSPGTPTIHVARQGLLDRKIVSYTDRYLPESLCPSLIHADLTRNSVHQILVMNSEQPLLRAEFEMEAHLLSEDEAKLLQVQTGTTAIVVGRMTFTAPNRPAVWYRGLFLDEYVLRVRVSESETTPASKRHKQGTNGKAATTRTPKTR